MGKAVFTWKLARLRAKIEELKVQANCAERAGELSKLQRLDWG